MSTSTYALLNRWLGLQVQSHDLSWQQMALRTVVVFAFGVILMRLADRRFLGHNAGFDVLLGVVLGSVLSRGVNGQAAFFPTLLASAVLVALHRLLGTAAFHSHVFSAALKGPIQVLIREGRVDLRQMRRNKISQDDLEENLRCNGNVADPADVREARLERNGQISVVKRTSDPWLDRSPR